MPISVDAPPRPLNRDEQDALDTIVGIYRSFQSGQPRAIEAVQDVDTTIWDAFTPYLITDTERKAFHNNDQELAAKRGEQTLRFRPLQIHTNGDMALVVCMLDYWFKPPRPLEGTLRITSVLERRNGQWKQIHHHEAVPRDGWPDD